MLGRNWSLVLRPLCRPQKNSKALRSVLKSDRFFFGVPKRLRKECLPLDLVFFLWLYSVILFFSSSLSKLEWSSVGNEGCLDVSCCRLWKPRLVSAALLSFPLFPWLFLTVYWWRQHQKAQVMQAFFLSPTKTLPSSLMDAKLSSVNLTCLFRSQITSMNTQESEFREVQPGQSSTAHLTNNMFSEASQISAFLHSGGEKEARLETLFLFWEE